MAPARASGSRGGTVQAAGSMPGPLLPVTSGIPPAVVVTIGTPASIASTNVEPIPSMCDGKTNRSAAWIRSGTSSRKPRKRTAPAIPSRPACAERFGELAIAGQKQTGLGMLGEHRGHGVQQEAVSLMVGQLGDGQEHALGVGDSECLPAPLTTALPHALGVDAVVDHAEQAGRDAALPAHLGNPLRDADHPVAKRPVPECVMDREIEPPRGNPRRDAQPE